MRVKPGEKSGPRLYRSGRGPVSSVTEIMKVIPKPYFTKWKKELGEVEADRRMNEAAVFGTRVHTAAALCCHAGGVHTLESPDLKPYADAVCDFLRMHVAETIATEVSLVSEEHGFGGTLDLYCRLHDGSYAVIDWKTTGSLSREYGLQTAAYAILLREHGMKVNKRIVVRIKKEVPGAHYARTTLRRSSLSRIPAPGIG